MDRFVCIETFIRVADARSITRAAEALSVSKSVVSERLSQLEELLGQKLLIRTTRKVSLSEIGLEVYPHFADLVRQMGDIENTLRRRDESLQGRIRVSSTVDSGVSEVSEVLSEFIKQNPNLSVELVVGNSYLNPLEHGFDLSLHFSKTSNINLIQERVCQIPCGLFASRAYFQDTAPPTHPEELVNHKCVGYSLQSSFEDWNTNEWFFTKGDEVFPVELPLYVRSNSGHAISRFVMDGHGLGIMPYRRMREHAKLHNREDDVLELLAGFRAPSIWLYAYYSKVTGATPRVRHFLDTLKEKLPPLL